jgi:molybdopterin converting factor small subunit
MAVRVLFSGFLHSKTRGEVLCQVESGTVREAIAQVIARFPDLRLSFFSPDNEMQIRSWMHVLRNGKEVRTAEDLVARVDDGDELIVFPDVA